MNNFSASVVEDAALSRFDELDYLLLPKLLSGELPVPADFSEVEAALQPHMKNSKKQERINDHQT